MAKADNTKYDSTGSKATAHATYAWNPGGSSSRFLRCRNPDCDNDHVDPELGRTLGDRDGRVHACPDCVSWAALKAGAAADPTFEHRVDPEASLQHVSLGE